MNILVVEDDARVADFLQRGLGAEGYRVQLARTGPEGLSPAPRSDLSRLLLAPMPGLLTRLDVKEGDQVEPGQPVAVMEAMKMENILRAPKAAPSRRIE